MSSTSRAWHLLVVQPNGNCLVLIRILVLYIVVLKTNWTSAYLSFLILYLLGHPVYWKNIRYNTFMLIPRVIFLMNKMQLNHLLAVLLMLWCVGALTPLGGVLMLKIMEFYLMCIWCRMHAAYITTGRCLKIFLMLADDILNSLLILCSSWMKLKNY